MFGLYESVVDGLINKAGGKPKYIASSATVNEAEKQVMCLFNGHCSSSLHMVFLLKIAFLSLCQIYRWGGMKRERGGSIWEYIPWYGTINTYYKIWSRLLKTGQDNRSEKEIVNFWTLVGYFNSLRELGGNRALYREDIIEWLNHISGSSPRNTDAEKVVELSSRIDSTDIPQILEELETGGQKKDVSDNPDASLLHQCLEQVWIFHTFRSWSLTGNLKPHHSIFRLRGVWEENTGHLS
jgi:hypothetical protein